MLSFKIFSVTFLSSPFDARYRFFFFSSDPGGPCSANFKQLTTIGNKALPSGQEPVCWRTQL